MDGDPHPRGPPETPGLFESLQAAPVRAVPQRHIREEEACND